MNKFIIFFSVIFFILFPRAGYSHGEYMVLGVTLTSNYQYNFKNNFGKQNIEGSLIFVLLNSSIKQSLTQLNNSDLYFGLGLANIIQIQYGLHLNNTNSSFRIKSEMVLFNDNPPYFSDYSESFWIFRNGIVISINFEKSKTWSAGFGLGVYI